jgi:hypothetical protein
MWQKEKIEFSNDFPYLHAVSYDIMLKGMTPIPCFILGSFKDSSI